MYTVIPTARFEKDIKYYIKKKRYFHIGEDIRQITNELQQGHLIGTEIPGLKISDHGHIFKVRSINTDTHSGQSNGYRILYYAISEELKIYLLTIYSKKDDNNIPSDNEIISLVNTYYHSCVMRDDYYFVSLCGSVGIGRRARLRILW